MPALRASRLQSYNQGFSIHHTKKQKTKILHVTTTATGKQETQQSKQIIEN